MRFAVLGPLQVEVDGSRIELGSPKQRRLLAALLVDRGRAVSTDRLVDRLWQEPPASAVESLRTYVYRLRVALGEDGEALRTVAGGYVLDVAVEQVDAGRFERLVARAEAVTEDAARRLELLDEALAMWRGPAWGELADAAGVRHDAQRLEDLRRGATETRFAALLDLGRHTEAVGAITAFVERHPFRERARELLALARYRSGRQAEALAGLREFRELLAAELGLDLPVTLGRLERQLLQQAPSLHATDHKTPTVQTDPSHPDAGGRGLPVPASTLVGRDDDLDAVRGALRRHRVVTITGPGGVGKSRVAMRIARELDRDGSRRGRSGGADQVWWCELARVRGPSEVAGAVSTVLGARPGAAAGGTELVVDAVGDRAGILVLDNAEHVRTEVAELINGLERHCPDVRVLLTSRVPLRVPAEQVHRLRPLGVDGAGDGGARASGPAVDLLRARIDATRPDLLEHVGEEHLVELCRRLDGLPLAIELAASRLRTLNPVDLLERLEDRPDLVGADVSDDDRHRSLRAVLQWSYRLLTTTEQRLFARLSVFVAPFSLAAAEAVGAGDGIAVDEVVDLLGRLVEHSLVSLAPSEGPARYVLLETLRAHGRQRLRDQGDAEGTRRRHAEHLVEVATSAAADVRGPQEATGVAVIDEHVDDLRAAFRWAVDRDDVDLALRLVSPLARHALWRLRAEVLGWAQVAVDMPGADQHPLFPQVAGMAGWGAGLRGDHEAADELAARGLSGLATGDPRALLPLEVTMHTAMWAGRLEDCLRDAARARDLTDDPYELVASYVPGLALTYAGRAEEALEHLADVEAAADSHGNPSMRALVRYARGEALLVADPRHAAPPLYEAAELAAQVDNRMVLGVVDVSLVSMLARRDHDLDEALRVFPRVLARLADAGDWTHLWTGLRSLVDVLSRADCHDAAAVLLGAVRGAAGTPPVYGDDAARLAVVEQDLIVALGTDRTERLQARGRALTGRDAAAVAQDAIERASDG